MLEEYQRGFSIGSGIGVGLLASVFALVLVSYLYSYIASWWESRAAPDPIDRPERWSVERTGNTATIQPPSGVLSSQIEGALGTLWCSKTGETRTFSGFPTIKLTEDEASSSVLVFQARVYRAKDGRLMHEFTHFMSSAAGETPDSA